MEACRFCDAPEHREQLFETLALPHYVNAPLGALRHSFSGPFDLGPGKATTPLYLFFGPRINEPSGSKVAWIAARLNQISPRPHPAGVGTRCFRGDIYHSALAAFGTPAPPA
jgi:ABC-type nitrate/sulfonate/bicarbonate transport system substrate-binding protein